eukprot:TRINITY_DN29371_c0_g1_i1.p1 TRINITY_DN29371_c0_g1~~TRINITY_DN29371_c0_g1_i1.p1  ORF type:complete len:212 (+),score=29.05 TRINITY_DN29371_c0_g1_i1:155-790(+)
MGAAGSYDRQSGRLHGPHSGHLVKLGVTTLTPTAESTGLIPAAYHTSVMVDDMEYSFGPSGIVRTTNWLSHQVIREALGGVDTVIFDVGYTNKTGTQLFKELQPYFRPGTYDIIQKNCNSFTDVALVYLLGIKLHPKYSALEHAAAAAPSLVQFFSFGNYTPNPEARGFQTGDVLRKVCNYIEATDDDSAYRKYNDRRRRGHNPNHQCFNF